MSSKRLPVRVNTLSGVPGASFTHTLTWYWLPLVKLPTLKVRPFHAAVRPVINALALPLCLSAVERATVPAVVPQLVRPDSTPPFCAKLLAGTEKLDAEDEVVGVLERELLVAGVELGATLERLEDVATRLEPADEVVAAPHREPLTTGRSTVPPLVLPGKPNETDWPGAMLPFQLMLVAV